MIAFNYKITSIVDTTTTTGVSLRLILKIRGVPCWKYFIRLGRFSRWDLNSPPFSSPLFLFFFIEPLQDLESSSLSLSLAVAYLLAFPMRSHVTPFDRFFRTMIFVVIFAAVRFVVSRRTRRRGSPSARENSADIRQTRLAHPSKACPERLICSFLQANASLTVLFFFFFRDHSFTFGNQSIWSV